MNMTFYGHGNPPQDEILFRNYFNPIPENMITIECGAALGTATHFFLNNGAKSYFIEPSKYTFKNLKDYLGGTPNAKFFNFAVSYNEWPVIFKDVISAPGGGNDNGSLQHTEKHMQELLGYGCKFEDYIVNTVRLDTFIRRYVCEQPSLLILDVEGSEVDAIESMEFCGERELPLVICVEYPISGFDAINNILTPKGYSFDFISHNNAFFTLNAVEKNKEWFGATERMQDIK